MAKALELNLEHVSAQGHAGPELKPNREAQRAASDLIERLHANGALDLMRALASSGGDLSQRLAAAANSPEGLQAMKNGIALLGLVASLEPALLQGVSEALVKRRKADAEPPGLWALFQRLRGRDSRRALSGVLDVLEATGQALERADQRAS